MAHTKYYSEDVLIEKMQAGEMDWLGYVNHYSQDWQEEYMQYCQSMGVEINNMTAEAFVGYKDRQLEEAMMRGDA